MNLEKFIFYLVMLCIIMIIPFGCQKKDGTSNSQIISGEQEVEITNNKKILGSSSDSVPSKSSASYVSSPPSCSTRTMYVKLNKYGSKLNVRETPSINDNIIGELDHGDSVEVLSIQEEWAKIKFNQGIGYIYAKYLVDKEPPQLLPTNEGTNLENVKEEIHIIVNKKNRSLQLRKRNELIGEYKIALGFDPVGHKEREGDGKTPEGIYYICVKNPKSKYYLSLGLSYPGISDAKRGLDSGLITQKEYDEIVNAINSGKRPPWNTPLGGQIMIHGTDTKSETKSDWTEGCIAVDNEVMDILWEYCKVGTQVFVFP